jgi:hypothetical protein
MSKQAAEHHGKAAEHHEHAARHHREAAKHHESGNYETAAHHAHTVRQASQPETTTPVPPSAKVAFPSTNVPQTCLSSSAFASIRILCLSISTE